MKVLIFTLVVMASFFDAESSFFTWVAKTLNPLFNRVFPEVYNPTVPPHSNIPIFRRSKTPTIVESVGPPRFYIDQNNTIRGLLRQYEDPPQEEIVSIIKSAPVSITMRLPNLNRTYSLANKVTSDIHQTLDGEECDRCRSNAKKFLYTQDRVHCHGYHVEKHTVTGEDGYILNIFRILPPKGSKEFRQPVLLQHGLFGSSDDWLLLGKNKSLVYKLIDAGYDVWLGNSKGNLYSTGLLGDCDKSQPCYWDFSWQDIGKYDVRGIIDHIVQIVEAETSQTTVTLNYIGHSMGATALLALLSTSPRYNSYIRMAIFLAPLAYMSEDLIPLRAVATLLEHNPNYLTDMLNDGAFKKLPAWWLEKNSKLCNGDRKTCANLLFFIAGPMLGTMDPCMKADVYRTVPSGGSVNIIRHYAECAKSNSFQQFNGSAFNMSQVTAPIAILTSKDDTFARESNVHKLYLTLPNPITYQVIRALSHTEFVWGSAAEKVIFYKVFGILKSGLSLVSPFGSADDIPTFQWDFDKK